MKRAGEDPRLARVTAICLALPQAAREMQGSHARFSAAAKVFAYYWDNHHGDGMVGVICKVAPGDNAALIAAQPERFFMPAYVGPRGWVGLRLDRGEIDWEEVGELVRDSYRRNAPAKLAAQVRLTAGSS
jgi:hypothetical protein